LRYIYSPESIKGLVQEGRCSAWGRPSSIAI
jgi:hypothetical protein